MLDPSAERRPSRGPGRPALTSMAALVEAAVELGLDRFTLAGVAERAGVGESTVYGYVASRDELFAAAAAHVFERLDVTSDAATWPAYVEVIAERTCDLAAAHPGLGAYVLSGPYAPSTVAIFETLVARVQGWLPAVPDHVAWVLVSRPVVVSLSYLDDPVLEPMAPWIRRALLVGLQQLVAAGEFPAEPRRPWRSKLQPSG